MISSLFDVNRLYVQYLCKAHFATIVLTTVSIEIERSTTPTLRTSYNIQCVRSFGTCAFSIMPQPIDQ